MRLWLHHHSITKWWWKKEQTLYINHESIECRGTFFTTQHTVHEQYVKESGIWTNKTNNSQLQKCWLHNTHYIGEKIRLKQTSVVPVKTRMSESESAYDSLEATLSFTCPHAAVRRKQMWLALVGDLFTFKPKFISTNHSEDGKCFRLP